jgi:SAM-dependent methyltransferase
MKAASSWSSSPALQRSIPIDHRSSPAGTPGAIEVLNLGCGRSLLAGAINLDLRAGNGVDIVHDLRRMPWPFEANSFDRIVCMDVLEHLPDTVATMEEIHRIAKPYATINIATPHFSCSNAFTDPTHCHQFGFFSFDYFTGESTHDHYTDVRFSYGRRSRIFHPLRKNMVVRRLANRWPAFYERHLAWIWPAWFISADLVAVKPPRALG